MAHGALHGEFHPKRSICTLAVLRRGELWDARGAPQQGSSGLCLQPHCLPSGMASTTLRGQAEPAAPAFRQEKPHLQK